MPKTQAGVGLRAGTKVVPELYPVQIFAPGHSASVLDVGAFDALPVMMQVGLGTKRQRRRQECHGVGKDVRHRAWEACADGNWSTAADLLEELLDRGAGDGRVEFLYRVALMHRSGIRVMFSPDVWHMCRDYCERFMRMVAARDMDGGAKRLVLDECARHVSLVVGDYLDGLRDALHAHTVAGGSYVSACISLFDFALAVLDILGNVQDCDVRDDVRDVRRAAAYIVRYIDGEVETGIVDVPGEMRECLDGMHAIVSSWTNPSDTDARAYAAPVEPCLPKTVTVALDAANVLIDRQNWGTLYYSWKRIPSAYMDDRMKFYRWVSAYCSRDRDPMQEVRKDRPRVSDMQPYLTHLVGNGTGLQTALSLVMDGLESVIEWVPKNTVDADIDDWETVYADNIAAAVMLTLRVADLLNKLAGNGADVSDARTRLRSLAGKCVTDMSAARAAGIPVSRVVENRVTEMLRPVL